LRETRERGHDHIGPEHILLGLLTDDDATAARILARAEIDRDHLRATLFGQDA
jgi:ATP-dependent Clp protease ATP-binding subunit ClpC